MALKLIHTADVLLDACFAGTGVPSRFAAKRRQSLCDTFETIVERAREWPADALLISGNLFDLQRVSRETIQFLIKLLKSLGETPVLIAPGPRDPYVPHSPYASESWSPNVIIYKKCEWRSRVIRNGQFVAYGFGYDGSTPSRNPFGVLQAKSKGPQIALGYGQHEDFVGRVEPGAIRIASRDIITPGLHYFALGGFPRYHDLQLEKTVAVYPGAPEAHLLRDTGTRHYAEVTIENQRKGFETVVKPVAASRTVYVSGNLDCGRFERPEELVATAKEMTSVENSRQIATLTLTGPCAFDVHEVISALEDELSHNCDCVMVEDRTTPPEDLDELAKQDNTLGDFVRRLNAQIEETNDDARRAMLRRARAVGIAAFRNRPLPIRGGAAL